MSYSKFKSLCAILLIVIPIASGAEWDYDDPNSWFRQYRTCRGREQSPIDIKNAKKSTFIPKINFGFYEEAFDNDANIQIENNGHSIVLQIPSTVKGQPYIEGGNLKRKYEAVGLHFHWGRRFGSEHTIDGRPSDLEMHIVHQDKAGKLAVLGVLFDLTKTPNNATENIFSKFENVLQYRTTTKIENFTTLKSLLGNINTERFYIYQGSLTVPPCTEGVSWFVFEEHLGLSSDLLPKLLHIRDHRNYILESNIRPIQQLNNRKIMYRS